MKGGPVGDLAETGTGRSSSEAAPLQPEPVPLPPDPFTHAIDDVIGRLELANRRLEAIVERIRTPQP